METATRFSLAIGCCLLRLLEIARGLVRFDHVASLVVYPNYSIM